LYLAQLAYQFFGLFPQGLCFESQRADAIVGVFLPRRAVLWFEVDIVVQVMDAAVIERFFVAVHVSQMDVAAGIFRAHFKGLKGER
jgi:hypothetical protein